MKQLFFIAALLFASYSHADVNYCKTQASDHITVKYNEVVTQSVLMPRVGDYYDPNIEVQVSTERGGLYSVYFMFDCIYVRSDYRWR